MAAPVMGGGAMQSSDANFGFRKRKASDSGRMRNQRPVRKRSEWKSAAAGSRSHQTNQPIKHGQPDLTTIVLESNGGVVKASIVVNKDHEINVSKLFWQEFGFFGKKEAGLEAYEVRPSSEKT
ncbi:hypothetical protein FH972_023368 [Carpinus fangiana]|uniref:Uncharacterized protein n=1 Tax=Carpinus fangiana TaxID=176857 RepID=A0A5N6KVH2_9ROSI|nr:hypothetical protein FH972_023368 [Carpinus fangiana]